MTITVILQIIVTGSVQNIYPKYSHLMVLIMIMTFVVVCITIWSIKINEDLLKKLLTAKFSIYNRDIDPEKNFFSNTNTNNLHYLEDLRHNVGG